MIIARCRIRALALAAALIGGIALSYAQEPDPGEVKVNQTGNSGRQRDPRLILRTDVGLLALTHGGPDGGGGVSVPGEGTGAGFLDATGVELGTEVRASRFISIDAAAAWYQPEIEVVRDPGGGAMIDHRTDDVDLRMLTLGLVITPPRWRTRRARLAVGLLVSQATIDSVPSSLGLSVDDRDTCLGFDVRGDVIASGDRRWGFGGALAYVDIDPAFVHEETGYRGSFQASGLFLRLGARRTW